MAFGSGSDYEARCTITATNGSGSNVGTYSTWLSLGSDVEWRVSQVLSGVATRSTDIEIRLAATGAVLATASFTFTADQS